jgi:hypothetical protein
MKIQYYTIINPSIVFYINADRTQMYSKVITENRVLGPEDFLPDQKLTITNLSVGDVKIPDQPVKTARYIKDSSCPLGWFLILEQGLKKLSI